MNQEGKEQFRKCFTVLLALFLGTASSYSMINDAFTSSEDESGMILNSEETENCSTEEEYAGTDASLTVTEEEASVAVPDDSENILSDETAPLNVWNADNDTSAFDIVSDAETVTDGSDSEQDTELNKEMSADGDEASADYPEQTFINWDGVSEEEKPEVIIDVFAPEGALPEGTVMTVTVVEADQELQDKVAETVSENVTVKYIQAFDITFRNADGEEIEPLKPVRVSIKSDLIKDTKEDENTETQLIHITEDHEASVVEEHKVDISIENTEEDEIILESDEFSMYVVVGTETIAVTVLTADGSTYRITVDIGRTGNIPAGAVLKAGEIPAGTDKYTEYFNKTAGEIDADMTLSFARFTVTYHQDGYAPSDAGPVTPADGIYRITVDNKSGAELPMTGGSGTMPFMTAGSAIMLVCLLYGLGRRHRKTV